MLQIDNVKVKLDSKDYRQKISQLLHIHKNKIKDVKLVKKAVDARRKNNIHYICSLQFVVENEQTVIDNNKKLQLKVVEPYSYPITKGSKKDVTIIGSGPAGLFLAYELARGNHQVTVIERGSNVDKRQIQVDDFFTTGNLNTESNIQFGEGGAGTFSDGKLTTGVKDPRKQFILETLVKHGATKDILYRSKPHVGTDVLRKVVKSMRAYIISQGGVFEFDTMLEDIEVEDNKIIAIKTRKDNVTSRRVVDKLVLAIGHSARDTYTMLHKHNLEMQAKPFAVGFRIEHKQSFINESQYGKLANSPHLPVADYKMAVKTSNGKGVYTFCMCPGGVVVNASSQKEALVVNGMSNYKRDDENANSAIIATVDQNDFGSDDVLAGMQYQIDIEKKAYQLGGGNYQVPVMLVETYLNKEVVESTVQTSVKPASNYKNLEELFSKDVNISLKEGLQLMDKKIPGFTTNALLVGVETRSSAPVRIVRDDSMQASIKNIYPIGEGAGYAGGIMSSAIDGLKCAQMIIKGE